MPLSPQRDKSPPEILRSPVWDAALLRAQTRIDELANSDPAQRSTSRTLTRESAGAVLARAHARLLAALAADRIQGKKAVSELVNDAVSLVGLLPQLWMTHTSTGYEDRLPAIAAALERRLSAHEHGVLSGELTYSLDIAEAEQPAVQMRQSLAELAGRERGGFGDLISVQSGAIDLAALLIRAAGNITIHARASEAPEQLTTAVDRLLLLAEREIATHAQVPERSLHKNNDVVGHHLAMALRLPAPAGSPDAGPFDFDVLGAAREAWLHIAALEHMTVVALDGKLPVPTYRPRYETLGTAITETAADVISGARLLARSDAFRHEEAWSAQSIALTHAREMYVNELPDTSDGLQRAQGIVLTRLVRAVVAITLIDLRRSDLERGNGYPLGAA